MELSVDENKMKELLKEVLLEIIRDKKHLFHEIIIDVIEEIGLTNAIKEGRKNNFVDEMEVMKKLAV